MEDRTNLFEMNDDSLEVDNAVIRVIGVGGCGGNAVGHMLDNKLDGVDFIVANTDCKALKTLNVANQIPLGQNLTKGLGAGSDPDKGQKAALETQESIKQHLSGSDMVFITAGMGGGTGTGAAPVVARVARDEIEALTVAVVTTPFSLEGKYKQKIALNGIQELSELVDALIVVPNQKLLSVQKNLLIKDGFALSNTILFNAVRGISDLITKPGIMGIDFADVCSVMKFKGHCVVGCGEVKNSPSAAHDACMAAIKNPLLEDADLNGAKGMLVNVTGSSNLSMQDFEEIGTIIHDYADDDALIKIGMEIDDSIEDSIRVTLVATGIDYQESASYVSNSSRTASDEQDKNKAKVSPVRVVHGRALQHSQFTKDHKPDYENPNYNRIQGDLNLGNKKTKDEINIPTFIRKRQMD